VLVPEATGVLDEELEPELEAGLVGHRLFPVTGTTGVVVPELGMTGVEVPTAPPGLLGEGVPAKVVGTLDVAVPAPEMTGVVVPELEAELGDGA
jgi:hypothetical protein